SITTDQQYSRTRDQSLKRRLAKPRAPDIALFSAAFRLYRNDATTVQGRGIPADGYRGGDLDGRRLPAEQLDFRRLLRRRQQEIPGVVGVGAEDVDVEGIVVDHMEQGGDFSEAHAADEAWQI